MNEKMQPWSQSKAEQARAKVADLDRQAREVEGAATSGSWRQRARSREVAGRLRTRAAEHLAEAWRLEELLERQQWLAD